MITDTRGRAAGPAWSSGGRAASRLTPATPRPARPVLAGPLVAGHLVYPQPRLRCPDAHQRLDLEARAVQRELLQMPRPEGVVAIAQVGVLSAEQLVDQDVQHPVAVSPGDGDVIAAAVAGEPRALREVCAGQQGADEPDDLATVSGSVTVDRDDDVPLRGGEAGDQSVALADAALEHDLDVRPEPPGHRDGVVP